MSCRAAVILPALLASCGWAGVEEQLLAAFFQASAARDRTLLAHMATVVLEPTVTGIVGQFEVERIGAEERRPLAPGEQPLAVNSLTPPGVADVDVSGAQVELVRKELSVAVALRTPEGRDEPRVLAVTLERAIARRGDHAIEGRWLVTGVQQAAN